MARKESSGIASGSGSGCRSNSMSITPSPYRFEIDEMSPGLFRVALWATSGHMINRRRDVAVERISAVKAALLAEEAQR
jgi:hypothetical protein